MAPHHDAVGATPRLVWHENLPIIGFLKQRGRCRHCGMKLSPRYIAVEILGGLFLLSYAVSLPLGIAAGFGVALVFTGIACLTDFESLTLHPALLSALGLIGICLAVAGDAGLLTWHLNSAQTLAGVLVSALVPIVINASYRLIRGATVSARGTTGFLAHLEHGLVQPVGPALFIAASWLGAMVGIGMMLAGRASVMTRCHSACLQEVLYPLAEFIYAGILATANIKSGSVTRPEMTCTTVFSSRLSVAKRRPFALLAALLHGCGSPERLPSDLSIETSKEVLKERVIAPIKALDDEEVADTFEPLPRRKLIQVRHSPDSLKDQYFVSTLTKLLTFDPVEEGEMVSASTDVKDLSESEKQSIINDRALERTQILVAKGLEFEGVILTIPIGKSIPTSRTVLARQSAAWLSGASIFRAQPYRQR